MPYPRRGVRKFRPRARRAWAVPSVQWAAPTLTTAGTFASQTMGVDLYGRVLIGAVPAASPTATGIRVYRSADNVTFVDVSANCTITNPSGSNWLIVDKRPMRGSQSVALAGTGYYKIAATTSGSESLPAASGAFTINVDTAAFETARFTKLHALLDAQAGDYFPSNASEPYTGYWLTAMAYAYRQSGSATYLTDCTTVWNYLKTLETADHLTYYGHDTTHIYRDGHMRTVILSMLAARILRAAGETTLSAEIIAKCDVWGKAAIDQLSRSSISRAGIDVTNASGRMLRRANSTAYDVGDIRLPAVNNSHAYRCSVAGSTAGSAPSWPTGAGSTVTDGTVTWKEITVTGSVFNDTYTVAGPYTPTGSYSVDTNQNLECSVAYALLMVESGTSFFSAGAYRTAAQTILDDNLALYLTFQTSDGAVNIGDPVNSYDTNYGSYAVQLAAVLIALLGTTYHPYLSPSVDLALNWLESSTYSTEPLAQTLWTGGTTTDVSMIARRIACYAIVGHTVPAALSNLIYTTAFQEPATEKHGDYVEYGATGKPDAEQGRQFEADAFVHGARIPQTISPTAIASAEAFGTAVVTVATTPAQTITLTGIASAAAVGTPTVTGGFTSADPGPARLTVSSGSATSLAVLDRPATSLTVTDGPAQD